MENYHLMFLLGETKKDEEEKHVTILSSKSNKKSDKLHRIFRFYH